MSTLAHELGHTMHSYYSNKTQPYALASYPAFVAEVASTFNEALLIDHMLRQIKDKDARLSILGNYLENIKGTVFRQTQFAEFELRMHEMAQRGEPITGDALAKLYLEITRKYYGHDAKVLPAVLMALGAAVLAGFVNGFLIGRLGLNPIVATDENWTLPIDSGPSPLSKTSMSIQPVGSIMKQNMSCSPA